MAEQLIVSVSGVRGTVGGTLTPRAACDFGCAFGTMLGAGKSAVIGRDTRASGPMVLSAVTAGLLAAGVNVIDLGVVSTPGVALMVRALGAGGGVVITASHNPPQYNGIKFLQPSGPGLRAAQAERLKGIWQSGHFALAGVDGLGRQSQDGTTHQRHVEAVCSVTDVPAIAARRFRVVLDSINGAGCGVSKLLMQRLGCELVHINDEPTGCFAHAPEPIRENLDQLGQAVREHGGQVGFAQDPDADRLVIVDERGRFIGEEYTLALATAFVLGKRKGKVATNMVTSRMIEDVAAAAGCRVVRAPTGEANVVEAMEREGCIFGGEGNGGVIDPRVVPVRNSLVGMAMILQFMAETGKTISQLAAGIPSYVMLKTKMPCPPGAAAKVVQATQEAFAGRPRAKLDHSDGLKIDLPEGWVSVRGSNTEPIMRITAEARDAQVAQALVAQVQQLAAGVLG